MAWADGMTLEQAAAKAGVDDLDAVDYAIWVDRIKVWSW